MSVSQSSCSECANSPAKAARYSGHRGEVRLLSRQASLGVLVQRAGEVRVDFLEIEEEQAGCLLQTGITHGRSLD